MNWGIFFKVLLRNVILVILITTIALGAMGYLLAGDAGLENGIGWGVILGIFGGLMSVAGTVYPLFYEEHASRFGKEKYRQASEEENHWPRKKP